MESGEIPDGQLSASSERDANHSATRGRLHFQETVDKAGSWSAERHDTDQWLQIDMVILHITVTRVATQGSNARREWVTKYKIQYGNDTGSFQNYTELGENTMKVKLKFLEIHVLFNS